MSSVTAHVPVESGERRALLPSSRNAEETEGAPPASAAPAWHPFLSMLRNASLPSGEQRCTIVVMRADLLDLPELAEHYGLDATAELQQRIEQRLDGLCGLSGRWHRASDGKYAMFMPNIATRAAAARFALRLATALSRPIQAQSQAGGHQLRVASCVGSSLMARPSSGEEALRRAEIALQEARRAGAGAHCMYGEALDERIRDRVQMLQALQSGVANQEFRLHYQPVVSLESRRMMSAEALLRWQHPELGLQLPDRFLSLAEESGLIVKLGARALEMAMGQARQWVGLGHAPLRIAVNVSGKQLQRSSLADTVRRILTLTDASPEWLELDMTEATLLACSADAMHQLESLRAVGVALAVDDFGAGYASLRYLRDLPITRLKIDQSFVRNIETDERDASILTGIVRMASSLGLDVIAKGVETEAQMDILRACRCTGAQGWLFARAMPVGAFGKRLEVPGYQYGPLPQAHADIAVR